MNDGRPLAAPQLAGYRADELIGRGGNGEVYLAEDVRLGRPVAIKVLAAGGRGRALPRAAPARVPAGGEPRSPERHPDLRGGRAGRPSVHRHALRAGPRSEGGAAARGSSPARPHDRDRRAVGGALDAAHRRRPGASRREAEQRAARPPGRSRALLSGGFRPHAERIERGPADGQFMGRVDYVSPEQIRGDAWAARRTSTASPVWSSNA